MLCIPTWTPEPVLRRRALCSTLSTAHASVWEEQPGRLRSIQQTQVDDGERCPGKGEEGKEADLGTDLRISGDWPEEVGETWRWSRTWLKG